MFSNLSSLTIVPGQSFLIIIYNSVFQWRVIIDLTVANV